MAKTNCSNSSNRMVACAVFAHSETVWLFRTVSCLRWSTSSLQCDKICRDACIRAGRKPASDIDVDGSRKLNCSQHSPHRCVMGFQLSGRQQNGLDLGMQRNATGAVHEDESQGTASEREMLQTIADPP